MSEGRVSIATNRLVAAALFGVITILATGTGWWIRDRLTNAETSAQQAVASANIAVGVGRSIEKELVKLSVIMEGVRTELKDIKENARNLSKLDNRITALEVTIREHEKNGDHK